MSSQKSGTREIWKENYMNVTIAFLGFYIPPFLIFPSSLLSKITSLCYFLPLQPAYNTLTIYFSVKSS